MDHSYVGLKKIIYDHSSGILSENELCLWSKEAYYHFLFDSFLDIEKIYTYPFIKSLSALNTLPDDMADDFPCSDHQLEKIIDIISGKKNYFYSYRLNIPWFHKQMDRYRHKYKEYEKIRDDILNLPDSTKEVGLPLRDQLNIATVIDLLEFKITNILCDLNDERNSGKLVQMFGNNEDQHGSNDLVNMLVKYIDCFLGKRGIIVDISYYNGKPHINIYPD